MKVNTDRINYFNMLLVAIAFAVAWVAPFELFVVSYALLGPLHYLTEIAWLNDRHYFIQGKHRWRWLAMLTLMTTAVETERNEAALNLRLIAFLSALIFVTASGWTQGILILVLLFTAQSIVLMGPGATIFALYLTTLIHVFIFTWCFMLHGSLKERRPSGFITLGFFSICALAFFLYVPSSASYEVSKYVQDNANAFGSLQFDLVHLLGWDTGWDHVVAGMRFIGFAYTYHYLNWFSKTRIIGWHRGGKKRLAIIAVIYASSIALYLYDYRAGLQALFFLSLAHVYLEFPLNMRTFAGIWRELRLVAKPAAIS